MNLDDLVTLTAPSGLKIDMRCCLFQVIDRHETGTPKTLQLVREMIDRIKVDPHGPEPEFLVGLLPEECIQDY